MISNRRAIILAPNFFGFLSKRIYGARDLQSIRRHDSSLVNGAGDLAFEEHHHFTHDRGGSVRHHVDRYGFLAVDRIYQVEKLLRETLLKE